MIIRGGVVLCKCGENAARYINARGELCCSTCPIREGVDSIKLDDVPQLLEWARKFVNLHPNHPWRESLQQIVQREVKPPPPPEPTPVERERRARARERANAQVVEDAQKCCCWRAGWLGGHHDDPRCEYR